MACLKDKNKDCERIKGVCTHCGSIHWNERSKSFHDDFEFLVMEYNEFSKPMLVTMCKSVMTKLMKKQ